LHYQFLWGRPDVQQEKRRKERRLNFFLLVTLLFMPLFEGLNKKDSSSAIIQQALSEKKDVSSER
jgi:hypothetical protein